MDHFLYGFCYKISYSSVFSAWKIIDCILMNSVFLSKNFEFYSKNNQLYKISKDNQKNFLDFQNIPLKNILEVLLKYSELKDICKLVVINPTKQAVERFFNIEDYLNSCIQKNQGSLLILALKDVLFIKNICDLFDFYSDSIFIDNKLYKLTAIGMKKNNLYQSICKKGENFMVFGFLESRKFRS